jgi:hypothetical protein
LIAQSVLKPSASKIPDFIEDRLAARGKKRRTEGSKRVTIRAAPDMRRVMRRL